MLSRAFDKFAEVVGAQVAKAWFFSACFLMVCLWAPSYVLFPSVDTWQLVINTATTIVTFLLVALLQNLQDRQVRALNHKLDALLEGLAEVLEDTDRDADNPVIRKLRTMAGVELEPAA